MKLYRNAIILVVILAILTGGYIYIKKSVDKSDSDSADNNEPNVIKIISVDKETITGISIDNKEGKFEFELKDKDWNILQPKDINADKTAIDKIASSLSALYAEKVIEENASDFVQYGLDKPATVSVKFSDGSSKTIEIGNPTSTKGGNYVKEKGQSKVYVVDKYTIDEINITKNSIKLQTPFTVAADEILSFSMQKNGQDFFSAKKGDSTNWNMLSPIETDMSMNNFQAFLDAMAAVQITSFVEENPSDLGKYGLKNPAYTIEFATATNKYKLLLGSEKERGVDIYAKMGNSNEVFTLSLETFKFLDKPLTELANTFVYITNIADVSKIVVEMDGKVATSEIQSDSGGDTDKDKFFVNGRDATVLNEKEDSYFRLYYQGIVGITMQSIEPGVVPSGKADVTITYTLKKDPGIVKVELIPKDSYSYYSVVNGKYTGKVVAKKKLDEPEGIRQAYKNLIEAMDKQGK